MPLLPQAIADLVALDGLARVATDNEGTQHVLYFDTSVVRSMLASAWPPPLPTPPTPQEIAAAIAARQAAAQQAQADAVALRAQIVTTLQGAAGVTFANLTLVQLKAVVAAMAWKAGALNRDTTLKPPGDWL